MVTALVVLIPVIVSGVIAIIHAIRHSEDIAAIDRTKKDDAQTEKIQEIHVLVNQRLTDVINRVEQLTKVLEAADIVVPADPAVYDPVAHPDVPLVAIPVESV